ncbi:hypothetical protein DL96DRAFT_1623501 [Flagelloscypha sp. PMI_526]|nr:hypothetical protein DL96DRAFT_1623501 [Flagelloscypha sp. PMI_526]
MDSSSHFQTQGLGTPQVKLSALLDPPDQEGISSRILGSVAKSALYAVGGIVLLPATLPGIAVVVTYILGYEAALWSIAAWTGTWEDYRMKKRKRWAIRGSRCGTGRMKAQRNAQIRAAKRAAAAEIYRREHGMSAK